MPLVEFCDGRVLLQHLNGLYQQIIEIHRIRKPLPLLVFLLDKPDLIRQGLEPLVFCGNHFRHGTVCVEGETKYVAHDFRSRKPDLTRVDPDDRLRPKSNLPNPRDP